MHGRIDRLLSVSFLLFATIQPVRSACVEPAKLAHSTVSIMRHFADDEPGSRADLTGVRATGWFLSSMTIVTAEHVTAAMNLSMDAWKPLEIVDGDGSQFIGARIQRLAGAQAEKLAVIELQRSISNSLSFTIRKEPLVPEEPVRTIVYPAGRPQFVSGRFARIGDSGKLTGLALLELYEGDNRLVIDHGASGAPVLDCDGRVVAVVSNVFTQSMYWAHREIRMSTAWGTPNVVSVPIQALDSVSEPQSKVPEQPSSATFAHKASAADIRPDQRQVPN